MAAAGTPPDNIGTAAPAGDAESTRPAKLPPAWFKHAFWRVHRVLNKISGGRFLWTPSSKRGWGALRLTTVGRKSGQERSVIVGYIEDGPNLVVLAMNGWDEGHPSWWLNLEAHPDAVVRLAGRQARPVHARPAVGEERDRLWQRWAEIDLQLDDYAGAADDRDARRHPRTARRGRLTASGGLRVGAPATVREHGGSATSGGHARMPTPTFEQLVQFREDYVDSWNSGDKERFAANWRQFLASDDSFQMFDPVGTPMKRGLVECALDPFDLWQPVVKFNVPKETFFVCAQRDRLGDGEHLRRQRHRGPLGEHRELHVHRGPRGPHPHLVRRALRWPARRADERVPARRQSEPRLTEAGADGAVFGDRARIRRDRDGRCHRARFIVCRVGDCRPC